MLEGFGDLRPRPLRSLQVGEEPAVVEGQGNPAGENPCEARVLLEVAPAGPCDPERQGAHHLAARLQRNGDRGAHADALEEGEVGVVVGDLPQLRLGDASEEARFQRPLPLAVEHATWHGREAFAQAALDAGPGPGGDAQRRPARRTLLDHVDRAEVGAGRHEDLADRVEGLLERAGPV